MVDGIGRKEGNVLFTDALNTFYLRLYGWKKEMVYLTTHSTHVIYGYMASGVGLEKEKKKKKGEQNNKNKTTTKEQKKKKKKKKKKKEQKTTTGNQHNTLKNKINKINTYKQLTQTIKPTKPTKEQQHNTWKQ